MFKFIAGRAARSPFDHVPFPDPGFPVITTPFKFLLWIASKQKKIIFLGSLFGTISIAALALMPGFLGKAIQSISDHREEDLRKWAITIIALGALQSAAGVFRHRLGVASWIIAATRLKQILARKATALGADLPRLLSTGEVVSVNNNDVERIARGFDNLPRLVGSILAFIYVAILLIHSSPTIGIIVVIGVPLMSLGIAPIIKPLQLREAAQREKLSISSNLAADTVAGLRVLRGIGGESAFIARFKSASQDVRTAAVKTARTRSLLQALQIVLPGVLVLVVIYIGGNLVSAGKMRVGELLSFYGYSAFLVLPLRIITETAQRITAAIVSARRAITLLAFETETRWGSANSPNIVGILHDPKSGVEVFSGELLIIVSDDPLIADELTDRLGGYLDADQVRIGEYPLSHFTRSSIRRTIYAQEKEPAILSGTIGSIFSVANSGRITIEEAINAASSEDILQSLGGEGLSAEVVERGRTLSGGQRQRLALARTLFVDAPIIIFDDPTSAVDAHTEARIAQRIEAMRKGRSTVIFSNSPLLLARATRVILLLDGKIFAQGSHHELTKMAEYRQLVMRGI